MQTMNIRLWIGRAALLVGALLACLLLPAANAADFLDPEDAFKFSAAISHDGSSVEARFSIADGYYLYRERFGFAANDGAQLGAPQYPIAKIKFDELLRQGMTESDAAKVAVTYARTFVKYHAPRGFRKVIAARHIPENRHFTFEIVKE